MAGPTRVKVYTGTPAEQDAAFERDRLAALAAGWVPLDRALGVGRLTVTYHQPSVARDVSWADPAPAARPAAPRTTLSAVSGAPPGPRTPPAYAASTPAPAAAVSPSGVGVLIGGGMLVVGSFLPWITVNAGIIAVSRNGMDGGDGWVTLALGFALGAYGLVNLNSASDRNWMGALIGAGIGLAFGIFEYFDVQSRITANKQYDIQIGVGLWLILAGAAVAAVASFGLRPHSGAAS